MRGAGLAAGPGLGEGGGIVRVRVISLSSSLRTGATRDGRDGGFARISSCRISSKTSYAGHAMLETEDVLAELPLGFWGTLIYPVHNPPSSTPLVEEATWIKLNIGF
jgi:hypothetical protein